MSLSQLLIQTIFKSFVLQIAPLNLRMIKPEDPV